MRRSTKYKWASVGLLGITLIGFNQCITHTQSSNKNTNSNTSNNPVSNASVVTVSRSAAVDAFSKTV